MTTPQADPPHADPEARAPGRDLLAAVVLIGAGLVLWQVSEEFPSDPRTYVRLVLSGIVLLAALQFVRAIVALYRRSQARGEGGAGAAGFPRAWLARLRADFADGERLRSRFRGPVFIAVSILYVLAIPILGYVTATAVFLIGSVCVGLGWRVRTILTLAALIAVLYFLLTAVLGVSPPEGALF